MRGRIPAKWDSNGNFLKGLVWYEFGDEVGRTSLFFAEPCPTWVYVRAGPYPISKDGAQVSVLPLCRGPVEATSFCMERPAVNSVQI